MNRDPLPNTLAPTDHAHHRPNGLSFGKRASEPASTTTRIVRWTRMVIYAAIALGLFGWVQSNGLMRSAAAQEETLEEPAAPASPTPAAPSTGATEEADVPTSLWGMFKASGIIGYIITLLSMIAVGFMVEHAMTIRKNVLMPEHVVADLDNLISHGQFDQALAYCDLPENNSLFTTVVQAGLQRYRNSEFGFAEYKAAVEEAGEEETSRLYRKTEVLGVIGAIAPMLGLLGTVQGMILGFNTIAQTGGAARPEDLASSISLALVTTFEGLVVAIPTMVAFSFFRNRIDTLVTEAGKRVEQVLGPLSRRRA